MYDKEPYESTLTLSFSAGQKIRLGTIMTLKT